MVWELSITLDRGRLKDLMRLVTSFHRRKNARRILKIKSIFQKTCPTTKKERLSEPKLLEALEAADLGVGLVASVGSGDEPKVDWTFCVGADRPSLPDQPPAATAWPVEVSGWDTE